MKSKLRKDIGFYAPIDAKKIISVSLKDEKEVLVGNNNDILQYFKVIKR